MLHTLTNRAIQNVIDTSLPIGQQLRRAQAVLDPLSQADLAELRAELRAAYAAGTPRFLCPGCKSPLYVAQNPAGPGVPTDGRGSHFKHHVVEGAPPCEQRSQSNLREIGAVKFAGLTEGADHTELKRQLVVCLGQDPDITDIQVERQIRASDGSWRQPDVAAVIDGRLVAFDIQLADAPLVTIQERSTFYQVNGTHHVWLTSAADLPRLSNLAFRDLHLNAGGRIFAIDTDVVAACVQSGSFQLKELSIVPRLVPERPVHNIWDVAMVGKAVVLMDPLQRKLEGEKRYQEALRVQVTPHFGPERVIIRQAAALRKNLGWVAPQWNAIARQTSGRDADTAKYDGLSEVLAWLHAVETYVKSKEPALWATALEALQAATERLLSVRNARDWAPLVVTTGKLLASVEAALSAENRARLTALLTETEPVVGVVRIYATMLAILYPWLAFRLIVKAPKFGPSASRGRRTH